MSVNVLVLKGLHGSEYMMAMQGYLAHKKLPHP